MRIRDAEGASNYREGQLNVWKRAPKNKDVVLVGGCWLGASWLAGVKGPAAGTEGRGLVRVASFAGDFGLLVRALFMRF